MDDPRCKEVCAKCSIKDGCPHPYSSDLQGIFCRITLDEIEEAKHAEDKEKA